jgi:alpha-ketoglutaric semialdehyde dehydrogenase
MELEGKSIIGQGRSSGSEKTFYAVNAATGEKLEPAFHAATEADLDRAMVLASAAFPEYRDLPRARRAAFLRQIAANLEALGDPLIHRVMAESALPEGRVRGELGRTCFQLRFFAGIVEEGSWVDARIDTADPDRKPLPKQDLRSMLRPVGPVAVFCASNFPLAFSVAGGDTASAYAAGCPVVVKAHSSHLGTAEMCGAAIRNAAAQTGMPEGVFSLLFTEGHRIAQALVAHPAIKAGGFTGSRGGGLTLLAIAQKRTEPIPFYAEMSSVNPVFILPNALEQRGAQIAAGLHGSITMGVGQFCTNPGVVMLPAGKTGDTVVSALGEKLDATAPAAMLNRHILQAYCKAVAARTDDARVRNVAAGAQPPTAAIPALFEADAETFLKTPELSEEMFGPASILVRYEGLEQALTLASTMEGNLTATIHHAPGDEADCAKLVAALETRVGRIVFNGYPTGVEVCQAMVHGGPYPSTSDGRSTSVGGRAIDRFARAVCYQDAPESVLPEELRNGNPAGVLRVMNGARGRE